MAISGIETQASLQIQAFDTQNKKHLTAIRPKGAETEQAKEESQLRGPSPVKDQVSISEEAQGLSVANAASSKNSTFEQSPFDK